MFKKLTLAVAAGAGYVLGSKAGTQRYEQIMRKARELAGMPAVQNATSSVQDTAGTLASKAKGTVNEKVGSHRGDQDVVVDLAGSGTGANTGATTGGSSLGGTTSSTGATGGMTGSGVAGSAGTGSGAASPSASAPVPPDTVPPVITRP